MKHSQAYNDYLFEEAPVCVYGNSYIRFSEQSTVMRGSIATIHYIKKIIHLISIVWRN